MIEKINKLLKQIVEPNLKDNHKNKVKQTSASK